MGLLDDAIREHLELKRAHGASDEEIVKAEQEALAPARRDPSAEAPVAADPLPEELAEEPPPVEDEPVEDAPPPPIEAVPTEEHELEPAAADLEEPAPADLEEPAPADPIADEETRIREVVPIEDDPEPLPDDEFDPDETPEEDHLSPDPDRFRARTSILDDPLDESQPPAPSQPPAEGEGQDVLEETPDFLQETPEHDKLWFEQKPPRDFDFD